MKLLIKSIISTLSPRLFRRLMLYRLERNLLPKEFIQHVKRLHKDSVVIDVGANIGLISEYLALSNSKVISFEPNSIAFSKLKLVAEEYDNIDAYNAAAGKKNQTVKLFLHAHPSSKSHNFTELGSLMANKPNVSADFFEMVEEIDFAEFLLSLNCFVELIKIDVEGFEINLINHLLDKQALDNVGKIYVEMHDYGFKELVPLTKELKLRIQAEGYEDKFYYDWH